jgi:hypothetical protein
MSGLCWLSQKQVEDKPRHNRLCWVSQKRPAKQA